MKSSFRPKKSFGQNFLNNPRIVDKIIATAEITKNDTVVEVGPGFGILTEALLKHAGHVISIEKDDYLFEELKPRFIMSLASPKAQLELIHADALDIAPPNEPYLWISNIPYSITSPLLDHFIRENAGARPARAVLLVQKEVAEKICAKPPDMNVLALHVQTFGTPKYIATVGRANFTPAPKVDSAIIRIDLDTPKTDIAHYTPKFLKTYFGLIHSAFAHKRKMLRATIDHVLLHAAGIDEMRRPETLSIEEWQMLTKEAIKAA